MSRYTIAMRCLFTWVAPLVAAALLDAQTPPAKTEADLARLGPQVGARVPDFRLADQNGVIRDLKSVLKPRGAMLVFFRSAEW